MRDTDNRIIMIPFDKGIDQRMPPHLSPVGTFDKVQNLRLTETGLLRKRPGTRALGALSLSGVAPPVVGAGTATDPVYRPCFLASVGDVGIFGHSSGTIFACDDQNDSFWPSGQFSTCEPIRRRYGIMGHDLASGGVGKKCPTVATTTGGAYVLVATIDADENLFAFIETAAGARIYVKRAALSATNTVTRVRAIASGFSFLLFWLSGQTLRVQQLTPSATSVTVGSETTISSSIIANGYFDVCDGGFILYQISSGALRLQSGVGGTTVDFTVTGTVPCSVYAGEGNVWVGWHDDPSVTGTVTYAIRDADDITSVVRAPTTLAVATTYGPPLFGAYWENPTNTVLFAFRNITGNATRSMFYGRAYVSGAADDPKELVGVYPISKPDDNQRIWVIDDTSPGSFCRVTLIRLLDAGRNVTVLVAPQVTVELSSPRQVVPTTTESPSVDPGFFVTAVFGGRSTLFAFPLNVAQRGDTNLARIEVYEYRAERDPGEHVNSVETVTMGTLTAIGGQPHEVFASAFPQATVSSGTVPTMRLTGATEIGFAETPSISAVAAASGSAMTAGTYLYRAVIEWVDMYGRRHQSAPSSSVTLTITTIGNGEVFVKKEQLSQRIASQGQLTPPYAVLYRTQNNGTIFHRVPAEVTLGQTFTDDNSDDDIADQEILYTDGGVLENVLAPACRFMRYAAGRLWCGGLWDPEIIECSKLAVPTEQIAFTGDASHQVVLDGACTGLASLDDQLIAFSENRIQAIVGDGPNDQGIGGFAVRTISSGVGCVSHKSILETDIGIFFQSGLGWYLLPRGLGAPQYVGEFFQTEEGVHPTCRGTAIRHSESGHLAMFLLHADASSDQEVIVYDLVSGQWTADTYATDFALIGVWPGGFAFCASTLSGNPIHVEDENSTGDGSTVDEGTHITATIRTNWIKPSGPAGWGQFKNVTAVVQPLASSQTLSMSIQVDDATAQALTASASTGITTDPSYRYIVPNTQKGVGLRVTLSDAAVSGAAAAGFQFVGLAIEYFPDGGIRPPAPSER